MTGKVKNPWILRRSNALDLAELLVGGTQVGLPTDLGKVAKRRLVQRIEFRPLLTEGGIAVSENGFTIYVRCEPGEGEYLTSKYQDDGTGSNLPSKVVRRARFTIAHEIAHTFFYDISALPPKLKVNLKSSKVVQSLETSCNRVAAELLLPTNFMKLESRSCDLTTPVNLSRLSNKALVAKETLVWRFRKQRGFSHPYAIIACIALKEGEWTINAISKHYSLDDLFPEVKMGSPLSKLIAHPDFLPFGGAMESIVHEVGWGYGKSQKMQFSCELPRQLKPFASAFVTVRPVDCL